MSAPRGLVTRLSVLVPVLEGVLVTRDMDRHLEDVYRAALEREARQARTWIDWTTLECRWLPPGSFSVGAITRERLAEQGMGAVRARVTAWPRVATLRAQVPRGVLRDDMSRWAA